MRVVLHIGAHKTASTHLQKTLEAARNRLPPQTQVLLPKDIRRADLDFTAAARAGAQVDPKGFKAASEGAGTLFLSEENVLGQAHHDEHAHTGTFYPRADARMARIFAAYGLSDVTVLMALRDPAEFFVSAYSQRLFTGRLLSFEAFLQGRDVTDMRWSECVSRIARLPQVARLIVWDYANYPAVMPQVLNSAGLEEIANAVSDWSMPAVHGGLSAHAHDAIMTWVAEDKEPSARGHGRDARALYPKGDDEPGYDPWTADEKARSREIYAEDLTRLAAIDNVELIPPHAGA